MSKSVWISQPHHPHPVPKGGSKTEGLPTLGGGKEKPASAPPKPDKRESK
jgi:hypothetical protein